MPITELVFSSMKTDEESQVKVRGSFPVIAETFRGAVGVQFAYLGTLIEENGIAAGPIRERMVFAIGWDDAEAFHNSYPASEQFKVFFQTLGPLVAAKPNPELFDPVEGDPVDCLTAPVTQIIKAPLVEGKTVESWKKLLNVIEEQTPNKQRFYRAAGIEAEEGTFVGIIGWDSREHYEQISKGQSAAEYVQQICGKETFNLAVEFTVLRARA